MTKPIWYFSVMGSNRGDQAIREGVKSHLLKHTGAPTAFFSCKTDLLDKKRIDQLNKEGSMLLIAGSGLYSNYDLESGFYFRCKPENFKHIKVPIVLLSIGMNNHLEMDRFGELTPETLASIKELNQLATYTSTRDHRTLDMLHGLGIEKAKFIPDPAMFCPKKPLPPEWNAFSHHRLVGLSMAQHAAMLKPRRQKLIELFVGLCHSLEARGYTPVFISHDALEHNIYMDIRRYYPRLLYYSEDNPQEMMTLYERCVFSVGVRCHSNIMSFGVATPFVPLAYDQKQVEFCKIAGALPLLLSNNLELDCILSHVDNIIENYLPIKKDTSRRYMELHRTFKNEMNKITSLVN